LHSTRVAALLGISLGVTFLVCFATGVLSYLIQHPPSWFTWPARPAWGYRVTQGIHVTTGIASIPLLFAKLWTVYPHLWTFPPLRSAAHALERVSLVPLVGGSLFLLFTGVGSISRWFPWSFSFPVAHRAAAWITIGALVVHVGAKLPAIRDVLAGRRVDPPEPSSGDRLSRRGFLTAAFAAAGAFVVTTVGQTVRPLAPIALLAPRDPRVGPQGLPVNKTAESAGVVELVTGNGFRLEVTGGVTTPLSLTVDDLRALPQREATLPIACVDGWSATGSWRGVPLRDLLALAGARAGAEARVASVQPRGPYRAALVSAAHLADPDTLLALDLNGEPLALDHGFPVRLIGPNRPGVMQTKWVGMVEVR
jgi:DMSO/TMAO reductase YedYZ molybdopterin-dependent catalytic subunit